MRILHAPAVIGGNPVGLAQAERENGLDSRSVALWASPYGFQADMTLTRSSADVVAVERARWRMLRMALREADVVHLNFGRGFLPLHEPELLSASGRPRVLRAAYGAYARLVELRELPLLKRAGKAVFVTFQGDDARQGDYLAAHFDTSPVGEVEPGYYTAQSDARKRRRIRRWAQHADGIYALNPDLLHVLPDTARFMPYAHVDPREWRPVARQPNERPVVLHAPTHRGVKGTPHVLAAVEQLKAEGLDFEFVLVEGKTQAEARRLYERADLLVDQLLIGWYGGLAVELMALGVPVICYIREGDLKFLPDAMREDLPIINAGPKTITDTLREWLTNKRGSLVQQGARSRAYVKRWHDPRRIAAELQHDYEAALQR